MQFALQHNESILAINSFNFYISTNCGFIAAKVTDDAFKAYLIH